MKSRWRTIFDVILTTNLVVLTGILFFWWWQGVLTISYEEPERAADNAIFETLSVPFGETLRAEVDRKQGGAPENGYHPEMFIAAFPGLTITDFEDVEASIGKFVVVDGQLVHVAPPDTLIHKYADTMSRRGFETLLRNVAARLQIDLSTDGTLTQVMAAISGS